MKPGKDIVCEGRLEIGWKLLIMSEFSPILIYFLYDGGYSSQFE